ncbi:hypothetical protein [Janthinobacterium psychrotolerans]|uniref:Uncharacterized protein n=1 Tax=Janthinobacterium psychrotolerans TaxID=1747903 RepID=A0A1A7C6L6_9BURK|nr:hypothetical protein [Janthinobacterium psychrotolerans]OBV40679.1 hypothetical protein ASR47_101871 [Janthinobacterium psychrotolerans]
MAYPAMTVITMALVTVLGCVLPQEVLMTPKTPGMVLQRSILP